MLDQRKLHSILKWRMQRAGTRERARPCPCHVTPRHENHVKCQIGERQGKWRVCFVILLQLFLALSRSPRLIYYFNAQIFFRQLPSTPSLRVPPTLLRFRSAFSIQSTLQKCQQSKVEFSLEFRWRFSFFRFVYFFCSSLCVFLPFF